jgi:hypothetical protein
LIFEVELLKVIPYVEPKIEVAPAPASAPAPKAKAPVKKAPAAKKK